MTHLQVLSRTQHIIVNPHTSSVSIINAGPPGSGTIVTGAVDQILLRSPNGDVWPITISDEGVLTVGLPTSE